MAADLGALPATLEAPPGLAIDRVRDEQELAIWTRTLAAGFGDFTMTPVLLVTLPVPLLLADSGQPPRPDFFAPDIHAPPLHIRHLTLIL